MQSRLILLCYKEFLINPLYPPIMGEVCIGGHPQTPGRKNPAPLFGQPEIEAGGIPPDPRKSGETEEFAIGELHWLACFRICLTCLCPYPIKRGRSDS